MTRKIFLVVATSLTLAGTAAAQTPGSMTPRTPGTSTPSTPGAPTPGMPGNTTPGMPGSTTPGMTSPGVGDPNGTLGIRCPPGQARRPGSSICIPMSPASPPMRPTR